VEYLLLQEVHNLKPFLLLPEDSDAGEIYLLPALRPVMMKILATPDSSPNITAAAQ
jgi:hypothetical protein